MRSLRTSVMVVVALVAAVVTSAAGTSAPPAAASSHELPTLLGWSAGNARDFEQQLPQFADETGGKMPAWWMFPATVERDWSESWIPARMSQFADMGVMPYIELTTDSTEVFRGTASGAQQRQLERMVATLGGWVTAKPGRSLLMAPFPEMNLDEHPWGGDPGRYKQAFHRVRAAFLDAGIGREHVRFVYPLNGVSSPGFNYRQFYPGDGAVDVVGFAKINRNQPWRDYQETFQRHIDEMRREITRTKPILITQTATVSEGGDRTRWLHDMMTRLAAHEQVIGAVYFNKVKTHAHGTFDFRILRNGELDPTFRDDYIAHWSDPSRRSFLYDGSLDAWVAARGGTPSSRFADTARHTFEQAIAWVAAEGITSGCRPDFYCPANAVTRGQMATFLARALDLPPSKEDRFSDDDGSVHEPGIQAVAAAGITSGCDASGRRFCPDQPVNRAQMATFLDAALDLPPADREDAFTDDDGSHHEGAIDRVASAGITSGCTATRFCPGERVTRGQMAAFLHRALT